MIAYRTAESFKLRDPAGRKGETSILPHSYDRRAQQRLTRAASALTLEGMEVNLNPDLQAKLDRLAADRGSDTGTLVQEAIERFVDHTEWFSARWRGAWLPPTVVN